MYGIPRQRKLKMECSANAQRALDVDLAGVLLDNAVAHRQTKSSPAAFPWLRGGLGRKKWVINALQILRSDPRAGVGDHGLNMPVRKRPHAKLAALRHRILGV